jgi:hypothetical protein
MIAASASGTSEAQDAARTLPTPGSIKRQLLDALRAGESFTSLHAWSRFGTSRLAALIHQLRCAGWPIHCDTIEVITANGRRAHVGRYRIDKA